MGNLEVLIDTNVIRRLLEDNALMIEVMKKIKNDGYNFAISDMSLFELLTSEAISSNTNKFLSILYDYKVVPVYKITLSDFNEKYLHWFKKATSIEEMKNDLFPSFSFTLSNFLSDFMKAIILFLANKLSTDYSSEFYLTILNILDNGKIKEHFDSVLYSCYINNKEKLRKRLPLEFKDTILRELTYFNLLEKTSTFDEIEFKNEFNIQQNKFKSSSFKDICSSILSEDDILISNTDKIEDMDKNFITNYIKQILCYNRKFNINDITDFINFKYAMKYCYTYYTTDDKSLKKYLEYFKEEDIIKFIDKTQNFISKYHFKVWVSVIYI